MNGVVFSRWAVLKMVFLSMLLYMFCGGVMAQKITDDVQHAIEKVLSSDGVERIEIINLDLNVLTRASVTPDQLEKWYDYKLIIKSSKNKFYLSELVQTLKNTVITRAESTNGCDVRWGIIFFDSADRRIMSMYVAGSNNKGYVDTVPVNFSENGFHRGLPGWLRDNFLGVFK